MRVFMAVASAAPAYGGPARSVSRLADELSRTGVEVGLWAPNGSAVDTPFLSEGSAVRRLAGRPADALEVFGEADIIHDNGIWLLYNHLLARLASALGTPRVVSLRGMLEPWALAHKKWKKRLAWHLYQEADLRSASCHHVTSKAESATVRSFGWDVPVGEVPNGVELPEAVARTNDRPNGVRTALFVGRVHPVKGLPMLIEAWGRVAPVGWRMRIVGPDEAGHRREVETLIRSRGLGDQFEFVGELDSEARTRALFQADLFVLPSHTENFGMAIGEALAHGLPVITTRGAPWQDIQTHGCGWWTDIRPDALAVALREAVNLSDAERAAMGMRGHTLIAEKYTWPRAAAAMREVYAGVLG